MTCWPCPRDSKDPYAHGGEALLACRRWPRNGARRGCARKFLAHCNLGCVFRQLDWPRGLPGTVGVPLFTYIYHEYAVGFSGWHYVSGKDWMQIRDIAANFICGKIDGIGVSMLRGRGDAKDAHPDVLGFYKTTAEARATFARPYLILGRMLRPTVLRCDDFTFEHGVRAAGGWEKRSRTEPRVMHSVWESPMGTVGYVLANICDGKADFDIALKPHGAAGIAFDAHWEDATGRRPLFERSALPREIRGEIGPREAALIEVSASGP